MRFLATMLGVVLAAGALFGAAPTEARADLPMSADRVAAATDPSRTLPAEPATDARLPQPATEEEESVYERREAESPQVREYAGGFIIFLLVVVALVLVIIILAKKV
jgi:DMSO/TMAO reductase YedYZ molybdopterin-dependent catalytic subunit